ncbi:MAG: hypothetical protein ABL966_05210, partial [Acidimicrobiales bacterium]
MTLAPLSPPSSSGSDALVDAAERVDRAVPGAPWWRYQRPVIAGSAPPAEVARPAPDAAAPVAPVVAHNRPSSSRVPTHLPTGTAGMATVAALFVATFITGRFMGLDHVGVVTFPVAGLIAASAFGKRC